MTDEIINETIDLADWSPNPKNHNNHNAEQVEQLAQSLKTFGQPESVTVWHKPHGRGKSKKKGYFLTGHGVRLGALKLEWTQLRADVLPASYDEVKADAYIVASNRLAELSDPDEAALAALLEGVYEADPELLGTIGYDVDEYDELMAELQQEQAAPLTLNIPAAAGSSAETGGDGGDGEGGEEGSGETAFADLVAAETERLKGQKAEAVRQVQLFFEDERQRKFVAMLEALFDSLGVDNISQAVYQLMEERHGALQPLPEPA